MLTEAEQYLLEQIRSGKQDAWSQLVDRYQGRLLAFARSKVRDGAEAEDLVQDTFVSFLRSLDNFRSQASLETYLFSILRRKIIDLYRGRRVNVCLLQDGLSPDGESDPGNLPLAAPDPTASWYARRDEDHDLKRSALAAALTDLIEGYKRELNFRDLQIVEMLFYCQLRNKDISQTAGVTVNHVAVIKHRCLNQIREQILRRLPRQSDAADLFTGADGPVPEAADSMIAEIWQERRLSCPKRSTLGAWMLG
ncbi:MAG TPA: sigma-70 family RNA polymerase sigma factor, partial [Phycisphaerae bacterium]|nr:sigma-70 family RNA polymerase sigma factor [Phycisphaerae bacterium]